MPHSPNQYPLASVAFRASMAFAALGAAATLAPEQASAAPRGDVTAEAQAYHDSPASEIDQVYFPSEAQKFANQNTVYMDIGKIGCSGTFIRRDGDSNMPVIGVALAKHCGFLNNPKAIEEHDGAVLIVGSNDQIYDLDLGSQAVAYTGTKDPGLRPVGQVSEVVVGNGNDTDYALGVFPGSTPKEVIDSYKKERLTLKEVEDLRPGKTKVYMRGWPENQESNSANKMAVQQFRMTYIGTTRVTSTDLGENIEVAVAAIPKGESKWDESVCSYGASGSSGFVVKKGGIKLIGELSSFWPLQKLVGNTSGDVYSVPASRQQLKRIFPGVDWNKYAAACGFNIGDPQAKSVFKMVSEVLDIPGQAFTPQEEKAAKVDRALYKASLDFSNPNMPRHFVNATAVLQSGNKNYLMIKNPLFVIGLDRQIILAYNYLGVITAVDGSDGNLTFYKEKPHKPITVELSTGKLIYPINPTTKSVGSGYIKDSKGHEFGNLIDSYLEPAPFKATGYSFSFTKKGRLIFKPKATTGSK